jgi:hypothetical protein
LLRLAWLVTAAIYLEIVLGAQLRRPSAAGGFGVFDLWVWLKVINAGLIAIGVVWLLIGVLRHARSWGGSCTAASGAAVQLPPQPGHELMIVRRAQWLAIILAVQLGLAVATWVTNYGWPVWFTGWIWSLQSAVVAQGRLQVLLTTAHAAVGSLALAVSLSLTLWLIRLLRGTRS